MSEPIRPRMGMKGTPFSTACNWVCSAGQVESRISIVPPSTARPKQGASPYSPSVTAAASTAATQPAPISMSPWIVVCGRQYSRNSRARRATSARVNAIGAPE